MNCKPLHPVSPEDIKKFHEDGVVLLSGMFDQEWIDVLNRGLTTNCEDPTNRSRVWDRDAAGRTMFWDSQAWQNIDEYRQFIFDSPAAEIAGSLMKAMQINFFFDAVFVLSLIHI